MNTLITFRNFLPAECMDRVHSVGGVDVITDSMARDVVIPIPDSMLRRLPMVMQEFLNGAYDTLITHTDKPMRLHFSPTQHKKYNRLMRENKEKWLNLSPSSDISAMANRQRMLFRRLCMNLQVWKQMDVDGTFIFPDDGRLMLDDDVFDVCMELVNYNAKQHIFAYDRYLRFSQQQPATEDNSESQRLFRMLPDGIDLSISKVLEFADKNGFKLTKRTLQRWFAKWSSGEDRWLTITEVNGRELIYRKALARA